MGPEVAAAAAAAGRAPLPAPIPIVALVLALGAAVTGAGGGGGGGGPGPVTCGSVVKLLNVRHNVRLHSHDVRYGSGTGPATGRQPPPGRYFPAY